MRVDVDFVKYLAIVSILGFAVIVIESFTGLDLGLWVSGLIFVTIGTALTLMGGVWVTVNISDGLTSNEIAHILTTVVGVLSVVVGLLILPITFLQNLRVPALDGVKAVVALFAIVLIAVEGFFVKR